MLILCCGHLRKSRIKRLFVICKTTTGLVTKIEDFYWGFRYHIYLMTWLAVVYCHVQEYYSRYICWLLHQQEISSARRFQLTDRLRSTPLPPHLPRLNTIFRYLDPE